MKNVERGESDVQAKAKTGTNSGNWLFIDGALRKSGHLKYYELIKSILTIVKKAENSLL